MQHTSEIQVYAHLRSHVLHCAAEGLGERPAVLEDFAEAEVDEFDVSVLVEHDVLGLEVAIDDVHGMEVFEGAHDLAEIEPRAVLHDHALVLQ